MKPAAAGSTSIIDVAIVDVENGGLIQDQTILIEADQIARMGNSTDLHVPKETLRIDGHGLYLLPGLIDAHVHFFDPSTFGPMMVAHGVTFVRDMGNPSVQALSLRRKLQDGDILGPEMVTTGSILDGAPPFIPPISIPCKTPEEGREAVRKQAALTVDQIKVYSRLEKEVFMAIADEARHLGVKVVGHVPDSVYIEEAAANGQQSCEHLFGFGNMIAKLLGDPVQFKTGGMGSDVPYLLRLPEVDQEKLQGALSCIRTHAMAVCPTLVVFKHGSHLKDTLAGRHPMAEYISPTIRGIWHSIWGASQQDADASATDRLLRAMQAFVKTLQRAEITLLVGTDLLFPGVIPGYSLHEELALWQEAGISPIDTLRGATIAPARFLGLAHRLGTVAEGRTASMVLVRDNPLEDVRNANKIEAVFLRGRFFSRQHLNELMQETKSMCTHTSVQKEENRVRS